MKTLSIKNVPDAIHLRLKQRARSNHRSLNGEILSLLERALDETPGEEREGSLADFLLNSPLRGANIRIDRSKDTGREVGL